MRSDCDAYEYLCACESVKVSVYACDYLHGCMIVA